MKNFLKCIAAATVGGLVVFSLFSLFIGTFDASQWAFEAKLFGLICAFFAALMSFGFVQVEK